MTASTTQPTEKDPAKLIPVAPEARASIRILVIDDELTLRESCASVLKHEGYNITVCGRGEEALGLLKNRAFDIVLIDLYMTGVSGMELLEATRESASRPIPIIMTGNPSVTTSLEALRAGAWDYLPKPFAAPHLQILVGRAAHAVMVARETSEKRDELEQAHGNSDKLTILGTSPGLVDALDLARKVAATDASVFLTGESGTGKDLIAQFIHRHSRRSSRQLVNLNCAALPESLLESEMFGHTKGAFTGAIGDKEGLLEATNGGTLFLDEVTEMAPGVQAKLLRVIQDGVVRRVGSNAVNAVVNVRFISATNRDPLEATDEGDFREDLYYRLRVVPIEIPPLRERSEDIPILARHFLVEFWERHRQGSGPVPQLSDEAVRTLQAKPWRGNVRELQNVIEHAVVLLEPGAEIGPEDLPFLSSSERAPRSRLQFTGDLSDQKYHGVRDQLLADFERTYLRSLVSRADGNMSKAARIAGVDRTTLYRLMEKHDLQRDTIIREN